MKYPNLNLRWERDFRKNFKERQMTIMLENVNAETLRVIESLKGLNKKLKILKKPNKETLEAIIESEKIINDIKKGKRKPYNSWKEAKKAMLNV